MLSEQMTEEMIRDGVILRKLRDDTELWAALERVVRKMHDDIVQQFSQNEQCSRKWLKGALETCDQLLPAVTARIVDSVQAIEEKRDVESAVRSGADDGVGSGDLAIA